MDIQVILSKFTKRDRHNTGGAYASTEVSINVDSSLPPVEQRRLVIHEVVEAYNLNWAHKQVVELEELIVYALGQLE